MSGQAFFRPQMDEQRIPGGCDDCNAYQTLDWSEAPLYRVVIHHDATCPGFSEREEASA